MDVAVFQVSHIGNHVAIAAADVFLGAVSEKQGVSGVQGEAELVCCCNSCSSRNTGVGQLVAACKDVGRVGASCRKGGALGLDDGSSLVSLLLFGLGNEQVVVGLHEVEFGHS